MKNEKRFLLPIVEEPAAQQIRDGVRRWVHVSRGQRAAVLSHDREEEEREKKRTVFFNHWHGG